MKGKNMLLVLVAVISLFGKGECGECCRIESDKMWCGNFCCMKNTTYCCDDATLRAPAGYRLSLCPDWIPNHMYSYVCSSTVKKGVIMVDHRATNPPRWVVIIVIVFLCITFFICCCCCCRKSGGAVICGKNSINY